MKLPELFNHVRDRYWEIRNPTRKQTRAFSASWSWNFREQALAERKEWVDKVFSSVRKWPQDFAALPARAKPPRAKKKMVKDFVQKYRETPGHTGLVWRIRELLEEAKVPYSLIDHITNEIEDWHADNVKKSKKDGLL